MKFDKYTAIRRTEWLKAERERLYRNENEIMEAIKEIDNELKVHDAIIEYETDKLNKTE